MMAWRYDSQCMNIEDRENIRLLCITYGISTGSETLFLKMTLLLVIFKKG